MKKYHNHLWVCSVFSSEERRVFNIDADAAAKNVMPPPPSVLALEKLTQAQVCANTAGRLHNLSLDCKTPQTPEMLLKEILESTINKKNWVNGKTVDDIDKIGQLSGGKEALFQFFVVDGVVNFYGNKQLERSVGLGELLSSEQPFVEVTNKYGKTKVARRVDGGIRSYYEDKNGKYVKIFEGYQLKFPAKEIITKNTTPAADGKTVWELPEPKAPEEVKQEQIAALKQESTEKDANPVLLVIAKKMEENKPISKEELFQVLKVQGKYEESESRTYDWEGKEVKKNVSFSEYVQNILGFSDFTDIGIPASQDTLQSQIKRFSFSAKEETYVLPLFQAIADQESHGNYASLGEVLTSGSFLGQRAIGKYQIMAENWEKWCKEAMGKKLPPTAENQDVVALYKITQNFQKWLKKGYTPEQAVELTSVNWYGNNGQKLDGYDSINETKVATVAGKTFPSPKEYALSVARRTAGKMQLA